MSRIRYGGALGWGAVVITVLIGALSLSCGLEEYTYLSPPTVSVTTTIPVFTLHNNNSNDPNVFVGYDFYYRLYNNISDANTDRTAIDKDAQSSFPSVAVSNLTNRFKYFRMTEASSDSVPIVTFTAAEKAATSSFDSFPLILNFSILSSTVQPVLKATTNVSSRDITIPLYRDIMDGATHKDFFHVAVAHDADVKNNGNATTAIYIQVFVVSFGYNLTTLESVYSIPMWMGNFELSGISIVL